MSQLMDPDPLAFRPDETADEAARAFERYNLVSAPVVNGRGKLVGRLTVDSLMDFIRVTADNDALAIATLMPIVASIAGNTGNQTIALVIRGFAVDTLTPSAARQVLRKELIVSLLNGIMWGGLVGCLALLVYRQARLAAIMAGAVLLNLVIAATVGVMVPIALQHMGRDPAHGASVLLTFVTDSMGFFLFLGLARIFL
jgi:magnesium transporter